MNVGSLEHKQLFCQSFISSYREYEPEKLPWPDLNGAVLECLQGIPFWEKALDTEREAGVLVSAYAKTVNDPVLQEALALQGREESRHARLIQTLIDRYDIQVGKRPAIELSDNIEQAFIDFGFEECLDSFFAFGLFGIARETGFFPEQLFTIFDPILDEEARHIVFFVNWFTYLQINRGRGFIGFRATKTLWHYSRALRNLIEAFGNDDTSGAGFTATGASSFAMDLTPKKFLATCLEENTRRMKCYDERLLQPNLMPAIASIALRSLKLLPQRKSHQEEKIGILEH